MATRWLRKVQRYVTVKPTRRNGPDWPERLSIFKDRLSGLMVDRASVAEPAQASKKDRMSGLMVDRSSKPERVTKPERKSSVRFAPPLVEADEVESPPPGKDVSAGSSKALLNFGNAFEVAINHLFHSLSQVMCCAGPRHN